jgi:uncharacterized protein YjbJ (UPF0337 family)
MKLNWDRIEGSWNQFKGSLKERCGKLNHDRLEVIAGRREYLGGKTQEAYGISRDEGKRQLTRWQTDHQENKRSG